MRSVAAATRTEAFAGRAGASAVPQVAAPHLVAGMLGAVLFIGGLAVTSWFADRLLAREVHALAGSRHRQKVVGLALQKEARRHPDLLPVYGSSEIDNRIRYHARELFASAPTGFSAFTVGRPGGLVFTVMESLGALAGELRGRKVVVSLAPTMFQLQSGPRLDRRYAGNVSALQATTLLLNSDLSLEFRQRFARRLLARPAAFDRHPALAPLARAVRDRTDASALYYAFLPLALLDRELLAVQDKLREVAHVLTTAVPPYKPAPKALDWAFLVEDATRLFRAEATNNEFGLDDRWWKLNEAWATAQRNSSNDEQFLGEVALSETWVDFEQLLQLLSEVKADALILSMPFHGGFLRYTGVSPAASRAFYDRVRSLAARYGVRAVVLDEFESDHYFFRDLGSHPSPRGWIHYDRIIDAFYHDALR